jgi:hypothetical protein
MVLQRCRSARVAAEVDCSQARYQPDHPRASPATVEHLAAGLELDVALVRGAVAESLGLTVYDESSADADVTVLIASVEQLTTEERRHVSALIASLLEQREQRDSPADPGDVSRAPGETAR